VTRRARRGDRAQASVELALLLPVVLVLLLTVLQVGILARDVVLVTHAAREGARAAATDPDPAVARAAVLAASGLEPTRVSVTTTVTGGRRGAPRVRVEVAYRAPTAVPLVGALVADRTIRTAATMRVETAPPPWRRPSRAPQPWAEGGRFDTVRPPVRGRSSTRGQRAARPTPVTHRLRVGW
jgi:Flp pilus assembly protein TadG